MPSTINGIGTTYFLKTDRIWTVGYCEHCGALGFQDNHSTWKCVCVLFIPIIPYGKARVMSYCSSCTRHYVLSQAEFEARRDADLAGHLEAVKQSDNAEGAVLSLCNALVLWGRPDDARDAVRELSAKGGEPLAKLIEARLLVSGKRVGEALHAYEEALRSTPDFDVAAIEAAELLVAARRRKEVPEFLGRYAQSNAGSEYFLSNAGHLCLLANAHDEACDHFERVVAVAPEYAERLAANKAVLKAFKKAGRPPPG